MPDQAPPARVLAAPPRKEAYPPGPCAMVIFGAGGDLTKRLLFPALYNLSRTKLIPDKFAIVGVDIADRSVDNWRDSMKEMLQSFVGNKASEDRVDSIDQDAWNRLTAHMSYMKGDLNDPKMYDALGEHLEAVAERVGTGGNVLFYLAVADRFFATIIENLGRAGLAHEDGRSWRRAVIEKPFGHSLASAKDLNTRVLKVLDEHQVFRIDHFLGKETVQNIMAFRFANGLFEPIWNRDRIDHVQITAAEVVGVEHRGRFYEHTGALRDMVPNHVFQLMAMMTMEPPVGFDENAIRTKKADVFAAIKPLQPDDVVRGQYAAGMANGEHVVSYREEPDVSPDSNVETYVALRVMIDNWRWAGVPFYLRTGKHLTKRITEIAIRFKQAPYAPFEDTPVDTLRPNWLVLRIQPGEGISLQFEVKRPGPTVQLSPVRMDFRYSDWFPPEPNVGYETLIYDCMMGDATLFQRADMVEATWRVVQPILDNWEVTTPKHFPNYASGSDGPTSADALIRRDGHHRSWRPLDLPDDKHHD